MKSLHNALAVLGAVFLSLGAPQAAQAQAPLRTPELNGLSSLAEYGNEYEASNLSDSNREALWRVTWDDEFLYVAVEKAILTEAAIIYIDSDPQTTVTASNGAVRGLDYNATNGRLPFRADAAVFADRNSRLFSVFNREVNDWGPQNDFTNAAGYYANTGRIDDNAPEIKQPGEYYVREFKVRWADISVTGKRPENFNWFGHIGHGEDGPFTGDPECDNLPPGVFCKDRDIQGGIYGQVPRENPFGGRRGDFTWNYYFTVLNTSAGSDNSAFGPAVGQPTSRASYPQLYSYTYLAGSATNFTGFGTYDFTLNVPGVTITRTGAGQEWNILGDLVVGPSSTLDFSPAANASDGPVNISGDLILAPRTDNQPSFNYQDNGGVSRIRVGGDLIFTTPTSFQTNVPVRLTGNRDQTITGSNYRALLVEGTGTKTLVDRDINIAETLTFTAPGVLATGANKVVLNGNATLIEDDGYVLGTIEASRNIITPGSYKFGGLTSEEGIGLTINSRLGQEGNVTAQRITGAFGVTGSPTSSTATKTIRRRFFLTSTNDAPVNTTLQFSYRNAGPNELEGNDPAFLKLYRSTEPAESYVLVEGTNTPSNDIAPNTNVVQFVGTTTLNNGYFSLSSNNAPLPVELVSFTGKAENKTVRLSWTTASEQQNKGFEIQYRTDLGEWKNVGFVNGKGTTSQRNNYTYVDRSAVAGNNYYRLRQIDVDGKSVYTQPITVQVLGNGQVAFTVSPVPTTDVLTLNGLSAGKHTVEIYNARGQRVMSQEFNDSTPTTISVRALPIGVYMVRVLGANRSVQNARFIKQ